MNTDALPKIILQKGRERSLERFHPWVFSGAIKKTTGTPKDGDLVAVYNHSEHLLGLGHYQDHGSIRARILSFNEEALSDDFIEKCIREAWSYRVAAGIANRNDTNVFRLVFGEGDRLPGLIVDKYNHTAVIQTHTAGMARIAERVGAALVSLSEAQLTNVYHRHKKYDKGENPGNYLVGAADDDVVRENGLLFHADWEEGQKTGFFIDQRENRALVRAYACDRKVLNTFAYTGGFSVYALAGGAGIVHSVDISAGAMKLADKNVTLNGYQNHTSFTEDAFSYLDRMEPGFYNLIVLDPPAFAKSQRVTHNAIQGYKRINEAALKKISPGGILFTFSCSQVIDNRTFEGSVMAAAISAGREVRIMQHLSQPADHPVNIFHPEGNYLKGLILFVK